MIIFSSMRLIITAKTGEGKSSAEKEIDKTVDIVTKIGNKIKGEWMGCRCMYNGTSLILEK